MEGLYFEASTTTPYHFLMQSELSIGPSRAQRGLPYRSFDLDAGIGHLRQFGVAYYSPSSPRAVDEARGHPNLTEVATSGPWTVFLVAGADLVAPLDVEPVVFSDVDHANWLDPSVEVFQEDPGAIPWTVGGPAHWQRLPAGGEPERRGLEAVQVSDIEAGVDTISFSVDRVGVPVVVRISYFPNWEADGADGPWRITPNLMVVVPTQETVTLGYGRTAVDLASIGLTIVGLIGLLVLSRRPRPDDRSEAWFDLVSVGPDGDAAVDGWVGRRVADRLAAIEVDGPDEPDGDVGEPGSDPDHDPEEGP
jgi:hypothetical protein